MGGGRPWLMLASFVVALLLQMLPLPQVLAPYNPPWVTLVLCYWCVNPQPRYGGIGIGWCAGFAADLLELGLIGQQALSKCTVGLLMSLWSRRFPMYRLWQQGLLVTLPMLVDALVFGVIGELSGTSTLGWHSFASVPTGALLWPWVVVVLSSIEHQPSTVRKG